MEIKGSQKADARHGRWPRKVWVYAVLAIFAFQIGAILLLNARGPRVEQAAGFAPAVYLAEGRATEPARWPLLSDPAAFALPNWQSFSKEGWLAFDRPEFQLTEWDEPLRWLMIDADELGTSLHKFILSNTMAPLLIADQPLPRLRRDNVLVGNPAGAGRSEYEIEGELGGWRLLDRWELPSWPHRELLTNTVVQAWVDGRGLNIAAVVLAGSGLAEADEFALQAVKRAEFARPRRGGKARAQMASGKVIFKWHTTPEIRSAKPEARNPGLRRHA